jgi:hypothetical protein
MFFFFVIVTSKDLFSGFWLYLIIFQYTFSLFKIQPSSFRHLKNFTHLVIIKVAKDDCLSVRQDNNNNYNIFSRTRIIHLKE